VLGPTGVPHEYRLIRKITTLVWVPTYVGPPHVHALVIGGAVTGIQAFR
jgi:glutaryl-CoA dehydrogenase